MRLLNVNTLQFREFFDDDIPPYIILSHTWGKTEVPYQRFKVLFPPGDAFASLLHSSDDLNDTNGFWADYKKLSDPQDGLIKILNLCRLVSKTKIHWIWVDTCCINKESSAELSEAINSMFNWYSTSETCIVYLEDVEKSSPVSSDNKPKGSAFSIKTALSMSSHWPLRGTDRATIESLAKSRWFTRGWCLQELIAPNNVRFYDRNWTYIGSKIDLARDISQITGIHEVVLKSSEPTEILDVFSVALKMSWAARRETTRIEDIAYSLMGLFGINMTLQYGEGEKAFLRLQKKIMKTVSDETLLAWETEGNEPEKSLTGLLAPHPRAFIKAREFWALNTESAPISITSRGACIPVLYPDRVHAVGAFRNNVMLPLNCTKQNDIVCVPIAKHRGVWYRVNGKIGVTLRMQTIGHNQYPPVRSVNLSQRGDLYISLKSCPYAPELSFYSERSSLVLALRLESHRAPDEIIRDSVPATTSFQNYGL